MQVICIVQMLVAITIQFPVIFSNIETKSALLAVGIRSIESVDDTMKGYVRAHCFCTCLAVVATGVFAASNKIHVEHMRQEIGTKEQQIGTRNSTTAPSQVLSSHRLLKVDASENRQASSRALLN